MAGELTRLRKEMDTWDARVLDTVTDDQMVKASQAAALVAQSMLEPIQSLQPPELRTEWLEIYANHVWVYAGVFAIMSTAAKLEIELVEYNRATGDEKVIKGHKVLDLLWRPNPELSGYDYVEKTFMHLELSGNAYSEMAYGTKEIVAGEKTLRALRSPMELWPIRPDMLTPIPKVNGQGTDHWIFQEKKYAKKKKFNLEQILPYGYAHPTNTLFGMGSLEPAIDDVRQDKQMARWNLDFFDHGLTAEGILHTDKTLLPHEAKDVAEQVKEYLLGKGRRILVLGKGLEWQVLSVNPKDVDFLAGRAANRESILAALGVPPVKVGLLDNAKYDNYRLQSEAFHRDTMLPKLRKVEGAWNLHLVPKFPDLATKGPIEYFLRFATAELLAEDADQLTARVVNRLTHGLMDLDAAIVALGGDAIGGKLGGMRFMDSRIVSLDSIANPPENGPAGAMNELEEREGALHKALLDVDRRLDQAVEEAVARALEERDLG